MRAGLVRPFDLVTTGVTPKAWTARQDDTMMVEKSFMVELSFAKKCGVRPAGNKRPRRHFDTRFAPESLWDFKNQLRDSQLRSKREFSVEGTREATRPRQRENASGQPYRQTSRVNY
jgi:hypothetical protein